MTPTTKLISGTFVSVSICSILFLLKLYRKPTKSSKCSSACSSEQLELLAVKHVPDELKFSYFFERERPFDHWDIFQRANNVISILNHIHPYAVEWLSETQKKVSWKVQRCEGCDWEVVGRGTFLVLHDSAVDIKDIHLDKIIVAEGETVNCLMISKDVKVLGGVFDLSKGSIYIGAGTVIQPNTLIEGPTIIGEECCVRHGAYLRGDVIVGNGVFLRGELKNVLIMNNAELCHPSYCGDSICGYRSHFGNQATTANLGMMGQTISIEVKNTRFDTGRKKIGVILGDFSQLGCNTVTDPGTLIADHTIVYPLSRVNKGIYGPWEILKNKPMECGVIHRAPMRCGNFDEASV